MFRVRVPVGVFVLKNKWKKLNKRGKQMSKKHEGKVLVVTTPSRFGSHKSMVVKDLENGSVICKDDVGEYTTLKERLDNGLADPSRFSR